MLVFLPQPSFLFIISTVTYFTCLMCSFPANEQNYFPIWLKNWDNSLGPSKRYLSYPVRRPSRPFYPYIRSPAFEKPFKIIWNVPSFQCHKYGLNFTHISKWGISQNYGDTFRGDKIVLLYDPGWFPALLETNADNDHVRRNGGVPQEGDIDKHLQIFEEQIDTKLVPDKEFSGIAVIDFEHWRPMWNENFGTLMAYRKISRNIEQNRHPLWTSSEIEKEASKRFEKSAWLFLRRTLRAARRLRPKALWGYYGFPLCFNFTPKNQQASCSASVKENNERMKWLFEESSAIYPSLYYKKYGMTENARAQFMTGRIKEAIRVAYMSNTPSPVYAYTWLKYYDTKEFVSQNDLLNSFIIPRREGAAGIIIWGASNDVNTEKKCQAMEDYVRTILGPIARHVLELSKEDLFALYGNNVPETVEIVDVNEGNSVDYVYRYY